MEARELRIGNWVMYSSKMQVNENKIKECVDHPERFVPLRITEEWLKCFGFVELGNSYTAKEGTIKLPEYDLSIKDDEGKDFVIKFYIGTGRVEEAVVWLEAVDPDDETLYGFQQQPRHVHTLQNLYFALTGEELNQNKEDE